MSQAVKESGEKKGFFANIGKSVSNFATKTQESFVLAADKNGDGKFDRNDIGLSDENLQAAKNKVEELVASAGRGVKDSSEKMSKALADSRLEKELKTLRPVFPEDISGVDDLPKMLRIVGRDKRRLESRACQGAVGYREIVKGFDTLCIYDDYAPQLSIYFYPNLSRGIFYAESNREYLYVVLEEYFNYIKKARVNELEVIAQKLGAKRVQIAFKEQSKSNTKRNVQADSHAGSSLKATASHNKDNQDRAGIEIAADLVFSGHNHPERPELVYFKHESDIEKLIQMRISNDDNKIQSKTYRFQCSKFSGIKEEEAAKIDAVASSLKAGASETFSREVNRERQTELEYKIEF